MKLAFNSLRNNQTNNRITDAGVLGKLRNTSGSITRKFKFCNNNSNDLNSTFNCVFNQLNNNSNIQFKTYHILHDISNNLDLDFDAQNQNNKNLNAFSGPFTPLQIKKAYSIDSILPAIGTRRTIVTIITAYNNPYLIRDVTKFGEIFKLPPCMLKIYNFSNRFEKSWAIETTLDVQWVYAINPYAEIRVIQATSSSFKHITNAIKFSNNKNNFNPQIDTDILNMSFGINDNGGLSSHNYFTNNNTIYIASSGDSNTVSFPSSSTNVLAIGGTSLNLNNDNNRFSEKVWKFSGCGYSKSFTRPSYQPKISNNNLKITPDFSCVADPITGCYVVINQKLYSLGGTSLSSPICCGIFSLLTQQRLNSKRYKYTSVINRFNSIQPFLYKNINCFFDVTQGSSGDYNATSSFDIASGLGVINFKKIVELLG
jgi:subtilase family serine protease